MLGSAATHDNIVGAWMVIYPVGLVVGLLAARTWSDRKDDEAASASLRAGTEADAQLVEATRPNDPTR